MSRRPPRWLLLLAAASAVIAFLPLLYLLIRVSQAGWPEIWGVLSRGRTWDIAWNSIALTIAVAASTAVLGIPAAFLLARTRLVWRRFWLVMLTLPLAVPSYVAAYTWLAAFSTLKGFFGAWLVLTLSCTPYVVLPVVAAFRNTDTRLEDVARSLGMSQFRAFWRTTLPQISPAAAAGTLLVALYTLSDFGAVAVMRYDAFTRAIYASYRASFDRTSAAVMALLLVLLALIFVAGEQATRRRGERWRSGSGSPRPLRPSRLGWWQVPSLVLVTGYTTLALGVPTVSLAAMLLKSGQNNLEWSKLLDAAGNTVVVAALGALIATVMAIPVGILAARYQGIWSKSAETTALSSHVLPGVVVGLSLVFFGLAVVPPLYQTMALLGVAYGILFLPKSLGSIRTATAAVPPSLERQARSLGYNALQTFIRVTLPLTFTSVLAGFVLAMLTAMKELPATLMLRPTGMDTLATNIWRNTEVADFAAAAPYAAVLLLLAALPAWWLSRFAAGKVPVSGNFATKPQPAPLQEVAP